MSIQQLIKPFFQLLVAALVLPWAAGCGAAVQGEPVSPKGHSPVTSATPPARGQPAATAVADHKKEGERKMEVATFGAGCFWGVEATYRQIKGVKATAVGFMGGHTEAPSYEQVCTHTTGHAEVVHVTYDPAEVSYDELLRVFWENHDPTTLNRQGPDVGDQYRSVIFFHTPEQERTARASLAREQASGHYKRPIVTQVVPAGPFWRAEDYHQQYLEKRGLSQCHIR